MHNTLFARMSVPFLISMLVLSRQRGRLCLSSNRQICRLLGDTIAAMRQRCQPSCDHRPLAFIEMPAFQVLRDHERQRISAVVELLGVPAPLTDPSSRSRVNA
jgi:hypothetical protein